MARKPRRSRPGEPRLTVITGEEKPSAGTRQGYFYLFLGAVVVILVVQAVYQWLETSFLARRLEMVAAEPGYLESSYNSEGLVTRSEQVITAPVSGVVVDLVPSGKRVPSGTRLATILTISREELVNLLEKDEPEPEFNIWEHLQQLLLQWFSTNNDNNSEEPLIVSGEVPPWLTESIELYSEMPGLLSYHLDGWESQDRFTFITGDQFKTEQLVMTALLQKGIFVEQGQPLLKLVDNWQWHVSICMSLSPGRTIAAYDQVYLEFAFAPGERVSAIREQAVVDAENEKVNIIYRIDRQLPGFDQARWTGVTVNYRREGGLLVPVRALLERNDKTGVFVNEGATVIFYPVDLLRIEGDQALVEGVPPYSMVITRPGLVREGQRLN